MTWLVVARALIAIGLVVTLVTHMVLLLWTGVREGFYSPAAVEVVQRASIVMLVTAVVLWRAEAANWSDE